MTIATLTGPRVTFIGENAGFKNAVGMYKIAEDGTIGDVQLLFSNASSVDAGGTLVDGESAVALDVEAGDRLGFFVMPDAFSLNPEAVFEADRYELRDWGGSTANAFEDSSLRLYAIDDTTGESTLVQSRWNDATWHLNHDRAAGLEMNADGLSHASGVLEYDGSVTIGFSDSYGGGAADGVLLNVNLAGSGAYIESNTLLTDAPFMSSLPEGLPQVAPAVRESADLPDVDGEADLGDSGIAVPSTVTFMGEGAGYQNTFGMYKIAEDGTIEDVQIVFANASAQGSGGDLIAGESTVVVDAAWGDDLGFFILPNGYGQNSDKSVFEADSYVFRSWSGMEANIYHDTGLRLFAVDADTGVETLVRSNWNASWHMHHDLEAGIDVNVDYQDHLRGELKYDGSVTVGFEDIYDGGDRDFDDVMFNINLGDSGATINDSGIYDGTDQSEAGWSSPDGEAAKAKVTFLSETADYRNTLGMYEIAEDGTIGNVRIVFANASMVDDGGDLVVGRSSVDIDVPAGAQLGFFILPDGYTQNADKSLFEGDRFYLRNAEGQIGNVQTDSNLKLYHANSVGQETLLHGRYGNTTYHATHDPAQGIGMNADGKDHALGETLSANRVVLGFEDIKDNGDWDFDDVVIEVDLAGTGAEVVDLGLKSEADAERSKVGWLFETNDDVFDIQPWLGLNDRLHASEGNGTIDGEEGDDLLLGGAGGDDLTGSDGDDVLLGYQGDDTLDGGAGVDQMNGGTGRDVMSGGAGDDHIWSGAGADDVRGGDGADKLWGGAGHDILSGDNGDDRIYGNKGADTLRGGQGSDTMDGGAGGDTFVFAADDLDGSTDFILGFDVEGTDRDTIDLADLGLLAEGQSVSDWLAANSEVTDGTVSLNLGGGRLSIGGIEATQAGLDLLENALVA
ncbi:hypothetical protein [Jannaschia sp. 2305UL9-9]|uniref:hypothetical protein n=1 Tax=Jannaschia sp. 2305UL9-9 TaxID=3121638 RepID=UPI0035298AEB